MTKSRTDKEKQEKQLFQRLNRFYLTGTILNYNKDRLTLVSNNNTNHLILLRPLKGEYRGLKAYIVGDIQENALVITQLKAYESENGKQVLVQYYKGNFYRDLEKMPVDAEKERENEL